MNITLTACNQLLITSQYTTDSNTLEVFNCKGTKVFEKTFDTQNLTLLATEFYNTVEANTTFKQEPLKLVLTSTSEAGRVVDTKCYFPLCDFICDSISKYPDKLLELNLLSISNDCDSCNCEAMCHLFETITNTKDTDGCCN